MRTNTKQVKKTLVVAKHLGHGQNGFDGCHARIHNHGACPGVEIAKWLNSLGNDSDPYYTDTKGNVRTRAGDVRDNYLRYGNSHVVAVNEHLWKLTGERRRLNRELIEVRRRIRQAEKELETGV